MKYNSLISPYRLCDTRNIEFGVQLRPFNWRFDLRMGVAFMEARVGCLVINASW